MKHLDAKKKAEIVEYAEILRAVETLRLVAVRQTVLRSERLLQHLNNLELMVLELVTESTG